MMNFNINDTIRVKLNDYGRQILEHERVGTPKESVDGSSEWQLWNLMEVFDKHLYLGCDMPFETTIQLDTPGE